MEKELNNLAFIDGQNLHLGTKENNWSIDYIRFFIYLRDKYNVKEAYYLIKKKKFEKILFPNYKFASSLYDKLGTEYYDHLEQNDIKRKIAYKRGY